MPNETGNTSPANGAGDENSVGNKIKGAFSWLGGVIESGFEFAYALPGKAQEFAKAAGARIRTGYSDFADEASDTRRDNPQLGLGGIDTKTLLIFGAFGVLMYMLSNKK